MYKYFQSLDLTLRRVYIPLCVSLDLTTRCVPYLERSIPLYISTSSLVLTLRGVCILLYIGTFSLDLPFRGVPSLYICTSSLDLPLRGETPLYISTSSLDLTLRGVPPLYISTYVQSRPYLERSIPLYRSTYFQSRPTLRGEYLCM